MFPVYGAIRTESLTTVGNVATFTTNALNNPVDVRNSALKISSPSVKLTSDKAGSDCLRNFFAVKNSLNSFDKNGDREHIDLEQWNGKDECVVEMVR